MAKHWRRSKQVSEHTYPLLTTMKQPPLPSSEVLVHFFLAEIEREVFVSADIN